MPHALCLLLHTSVSRYPCGDTDATTELALLVVQVCIMALLPCMPDEHDKLLLMVHVTDIMLHAQPFCCAALPRLREGSDQKGFLEKLITNCLYCFVAGAEPRIYTQVSDPSKMLVVLKEYLSDYNAISKKPMQLVLFQFALEHVSRICRIITSPGECFIT